MTREDRNGWTRIAIMGSGLAVALWTGQEAWVYLAVLIMVGFQIANGEGMS